MPEIREEIRQKNLWLELIQGEFSSISRSGRFKSLITLYPQLKLIGVSKQLLVTGVFVGGWHCCPLQLQNIPKLAPQLCLRFNSDNEWNAFSTTVDIKVNQRSISQHGFILEFGDEIQIGDYTFRIVPKPMLNEEIKKVSAELDMLMGQSLESDTLRGTEPGMETDFDLRLKR